MYDTPSIEDWCGLVEVIIVVLSLVSTNLAQWLNGLACVR